MKYKYFNSHKIDMMILRIVAFVVLFAFGTLGTLNAKNSNEELKIHLSFQNRELKDVMKEIKSQTNLDFVYNNTEIDETRKISVAVADVNLETALKACLDQLNISYRLKDNIIVLNKKVAQPTTQKVNEDELKGKVIDEKGQALPGVTVNVLGTDLYAITDGNGEFLFKKYPKLANTKLVFTFVGLNDLIYEIKGGEKIVATMTTNVTIIEDVIITGMGNIKREKMTGSASVISAKDLKMQGITSIDRVLEGMVAGLNSTTISGAPGTRSKVAIRGQNNLSGNTEPLWIIDGLPLMSGVPKNNTGDYAGTIMQDGVGNVMPEDIESITILKDASAAAIYGARAANGVIVITTKKGFRSKTLVSYSGTYELSTAPNVDFGFMNSSEKLRYERSIVDSYGMGLVTRTGQGGYLYKRMMEGSITKTEYQNKLNQLGGTNTDWFKEIFRVAQSHSHNVSLRGGSEELSYYTSLNFQEKNGILLPNNYSNAGILMNLDYRPIKNLIVSLNVSANTRKNRDHASAADPFTYAMFANPYERPYDENGNYAADLSYLASNYTNETSSGYVYDSFNILREMEQNRTTQTGLDADFTLNIKYELMKGLSLETIMRKGVSYNTEMIEVDAGTYSSYANEKFYRLAYPNNSLIPSEYNNGDLTERSGKNYNWSIRNQIDYSLSIKKHLFTILVASETTSKKYNNFGYTSPMYYSDYRITGAPAFGEDVTYNKMNPAIGNMFVTNDGQDRTVSFLGSFRYDFDNRYVLNFNYRADGADVIGDTNRFTPLWSLGLRYNLHNEKFFKNSVVSELSLRGSYGYTGNIDRTAYPFSTITFGSDTYMGNRYIDSFTYPNPAVGWEKKRDINAGIDMSFLDNRINFTADYYSTRTTNILEDLSVPISTGRESVRANGGIVENKGVEFYLNVRWVNTNNFSFSTSVNMAHNTNVIKRSFQAFNDYKESIKSNVSKGGQINIIGQETGSIYGWKTAGVNPQTGNPRYLLTEQGKREYAMFLDGWNALSPDEKKMYGPTLGNIDMMQDAIDYVNDPMSKQHYRSSMQYLGASNPKIVGGFGTNLRFKGLEFSTQWTFKVGHIIPSFNDLQNAPNNSGDPDRIAIGWTSDLQISATNRQKEFLNFWKAPGDQTNVRRFIPVGEQDNWASTHTDLNYEKGDYLRMTNLSLNYRFSPEFSKKLGMNSLTVGFNARNLITFTKYKGLDVGTGGAFAYPVSKEFNFKLSIAF